MTREYVVRRDVEIPMRDGCVLRADVWLPDGPEPHPALLQRTPYDKSDPVAVEHDAQLHRLSALDAGFVVITQDTRGRFASEGAFDPFIHETDDGIDTMAWVRAQPFSNGWVGTYGASYVGATQLLPATSGQAAQDAMAPCVTSADYCEPWSYRGGALQLGFLLWWVAESLALPDAEHRELADDSPVRRFAELLRANPEAILRRVPLLDADLVAVAPYLRPWLAGGRGNPYWQGISAIDAADRVTAPALHIAGFNDIFIEGSLEAFTRFRDSAATARARNGQFLIVGPWSHGNFGEWQGRRWMGSSAAAWAYDLNRAQLEFFRAVSEGRFPRRSPVVYFTTGTNTWHEAESWPPPTREIDLFLGDSGTLTRSQQPAPGRASYLSDPLRPVPTVGGPTFLPGLQTNENAGPQDQADVEARDDVLVFRSEVIDDDLGVTGRVRLALWATSDAMDCDWTARLVDVDPSGTAVGIVDGILRSRYRFGQDPMPLVPGRAELFDVDLGTISHVFLAGHRIGLQVASSNFPRFDRNPQTMADPVTAGPDHFRAARQSVLFGGAYLSRLVLPSIPVSTALED